MAKLALSLSIDIAKVAFWGGVHVPPFFLPTYYYNKYFLLYVLSLLYISRSTPMRSGSSRWRTFSCPRCCFKNTSVQSCPAQC